MFYRLTGCFTFCTALLLFGTGQAQAEPLIVTEGVETPEVHCSVAATHSGTELWEMIGKPFAVVYDDQAPGRCLTAEAKLAKNTPRPVTTPPLPRPGVPPTPWCYCRYEVAESMREHIQALDIGLYQKILASEYMTHGFTTFEALVDQDPFLQNQFRDVQDKPYRLKNELFEQIERDLSRRYGRDTAIPTN